VVFASVLLKPASFSIKVVINPPHNHQSAEKPGTPQYFLYPLQEPLTFVIFPGNTYFHVGISDVPPPELGRPVATSKMGKRQLLPSSHLVAASRCRSHLTLRPSSSSAISSVATRYSGVVRALRPSSSRLLTPLHGRSPAMTESPYHSGEIMSPIATLNLIFIHLTTMPVKKACGLSVTCF
jgi:hypothetical protein